MTSGWIYNGKEFDEADVPEKALCFIYKITRLNDGKAYIGKKLLFFTKTVVKTVQLKSGVKKKKKIRTLIPSDWKSYWSSSAELIADVQKYGSDAFEREILVFVENKGSASYYELRYQMDLRVLENRDKWYNGIVNARVNWAHIRPPLN